MSRRRFFAAHLVLLACVSGCSAPGNRTSDLRPERPAFISHIVFVKLNDPADAREILADAERLVAPIPGVASFAAGQHLDTGRQTIIADYDLGMYIGFETEAEYASYVTHPDHIAFVEKWRPRLAWLRIYDIGDPTP